jgi:hypothetical protein
MPTPKEHNRSRGGDNTTALPPLGLLKMTTCPPSPSREACEDWPTAAGQRPTEATTMDFGSYHESWAEAVAS